MNNKIIRIKLKDKFNQVHNILEIAFRMELDLVKM